MVPFMTGQLGDPAKPVDGLAEMRNVKENVTILGVFDKTSDPRYQTFQNACEEFIYKYCIVTCVVIVQSIREDHGLFYTTDEAVMKRYDANAGTEDTKPEEIEDFIKKHEFPLVGSFDSDKDRYSKRSPLCLMFYTVDWSVHHREATQLWRRKLAAIAKDYLDITFAIADEDLNSQLFRDFGLVESGEDINLGIVADGKKYPIKPMEEYDEDHIREFLDQFKRGELQPRVRSQPIPKKQQGPVTVVVAKTFDKIVRDPTKDVFISLYDPSCQKSRELEPTLNKLARRFRSVKNFVIAEMDGKANDIPTGYEVNTFPAFFFSPTDSKDKPLRYDGEREVGDFIQFLKDQASVSLDSLKCDDLGDSLTDEPNVSLDSAKGEASVSFDSLRDEASVSFDSSKSEPSVSLGSLKCEASVPSDCFRDGAYVLGSLKDEASVSLDSAKGEANVSLDSTKGEANVSLDSLKDREASASFDSSKGKPSASLDSSKGEASVSSGRFEDEAYVLGSLKDESVVEERDLRTMN
ncbi:hypothetical protein BaRGS_00000115 [Batillaria attramentaria]|uniref:Thioredoxin domain-containing protein n=1 Tax=Batillaria attramentaria TaxID=370345 RepID=A0ABD0M9L0_9CAEN